MVKVSERVEFMVKGFFVFVATMLMVFSFASAKDFIIENSSDSGQTYFSVNGTSGNVGIGTSLISSHFHVNDGDVISDI